MAKNFRLTLSGTYDGVNWSNVWHYRSESNDSNQAAELITVFNTELMNAIRGIMNVEVSITSLSAVDVPDTGDYASSVFAGLNGTFGVASTRLPPAYTSSFRLNTSGSVIRHGFKRFVGVDEGAVASGLPSTAFNSAATTLIAKFDDSLAGGTYTFIPIVPRYTGDPATITLFTPVTGGAFSKFGYQKTREG